MGAEIVSSGECVTAALLSALSSVAVLVGLFFYLNHYTRRDYFTIWGAAWLFHGLWLLLRVSLPPTPAHDWGLILGHWCIGISAVLLLWGSLRFAELAIPERSMGFFLAFICTWGLAASRLGVDQFWTQFPVFMLAGTASLTASAGFFKRRQHHDSIGATMLAGGFALWAFYLIGYPVVEANSAWNSGWVFLSSGLQLFIGVGMIVLMLEEARAGTDRVTRELQAVRNEKESLQVKIVSTEATLRDLFGEKALQGDLQMAYETLRETQQQVVQQERLRALGQMASGIAHDINNSLTPIIGYADFLIDVDGAVPQESKKHLECIRTAARDIARLVERVRQFYRRREESEPLTLVDLNSLIRDVVELTRPRWKNIAQKEGVQLTVETDLQKDLPSIRENEGELREAIINLVLNAIDAMPTGGALKLVTRLEEKSGVQGSEDGAGRVIVEVCDTGVGMDEATRQRCLEPFFSTKGPRGNGLGLAMVYGLVRRHQGNIQIESQPGRGTIVRLVLNPVEPAAKPAETTESEPGLPALRILCIDDDQRIVGMLRQVLASQHHLVEVADGGEEGVVAFRKAQSRGEPFQVVITDLGMPNVDGREIVRTVKAEAPGTPVIMLTGWAAMMDEAGEVPKDVDAVVGKPPTIHRLREALAQVTKACAA
ncbi:MAG: ATP-binding protein [Verrucomicrobiia bacterium]